MTETYTVDSGDKLTQVSVSGVPTKTFGYDGAGRTTSIQTSSGTTSFTYDFESRVAGITYPNSSTNSFAYNGLDTRVGKTDSAGTSTFRRMGAGVAAPVLGDGSASFTPGISERRGSTSSFYGADYLGTNSALYTSGETVSATRQYDAFGNLVASSGSSANPFGFAGNWGYQYDSDSGLKLLGHRYYDASTGRFLTRDPIKDGRNWYAYCANNPVQYTDPTGLFGAVAIGLAIVNWVTSGGQLHQDPHGGLYMTGGIVAAINPDGNAVTIGPITYIDSSFETAYLADHKLMKHEHAHVTQSLFLGDLYLPLYAVGALVGAIDEVFLYPITSVHGPLGHDHNPMEIMADQMSGSDNPNGPWYQPFLRILQSMVS